MTTENIGLVVDVYDDDDEDEIEKENEEVRDFVRCHPMLLPDDEEGETFWKKVIHRLKGDLGINEMMIYALVRFDIIKRMYENLTDKRVIVKCGKDLNRDGKWDCMAINQTLLALAMDELNDTDKNITSQVRVIEHWWDGIGKWRA